MRSSLSLRLESLSRTPAVIRYAGRALGADTDEVLAELDNIEAEGEGSR